MAVSTDTRNLKLAAAQRLARLESCTAIVPFQAGDEEVVCGHCQFGVYHVADGWRHDPNEIRAMRAMVVEWPR